MKCPYCAGRIEDNAATCRHCGQRLDSVATRGAQGLGQEIDTRIFLLILVLVLAALCYFVTVFNEGEQRPPSVPYRRYSQSQGRQSYRDATGHDQVFG